MDCVKVIALISLLILVVAAWIGFVDVNDKNDIANRFSSWIKRTFKYKCLQRPYILTRIGLIIGFIFGIVAIVLS